MRALAAAHDARVKGAAERRRKALIAGSVGAMVVIALGIAAVVWVTSSTSSRTVAMSPVAVNAGCANCHSVDGSRREGPTWQGLAGSDVPLQDGSVTIADADYIRRALEDPAAEVRQGFTPMPAQQLTPEQVEQLVDYIGGLG